MDPEATPRAVEPASVAGVAVPAGQPGSGASMRFELAPVIASSRLPVVEIAPGESKTIGRGTRADVMVEDASLSRLHARLAVDFTGALSVEDLSSTNGVTVNGARQARASLQAGDVVGFGRVEYRVARRSDAPEVGIQPFEQTIIRVAIPRDAPPPGDRVLLEALLATSRELMAFDDLPALLERVLDRVQAILKPDRAAILLVDAATGALTPRAVRPRRAYTSVSEFASSTIIREALAAREALIVVDPTMDPRLQAAQSLVGAHVRSAICVPLIGRQGPIGALYADRVGSGQVFTPELVQYAAAFAASAGVAVETAQLYDDRERYFRATLEAFAKAIDARDPYTAGHSERVTAYATALGERFGLGEGDLETLRRGGMLHDIGKVGVPDAVLGKPGPLDARERAAIEPHPRIGFFMLESLPFLTDALPAVRGHHERWDGQGYPDKLAGPAIPIHARLLAVADSYDAMTSTRPYRGALPLEETARRLRAGKGQQFDPTAIELFDAMEPEFQSIRDRTRKVE